MWCRRLLSIRLSILLYLLVRDHIIRFYFAILCVVETYYVYSSVDYFVIIVRTSATIVQQYTRKNTLFLYTAGVPLLPLFTLLPVEQNDSPTWTTTILPVFVSVAIVDATTTCVRA